MFIYLWRREWMLSHQSFDFSAKYCWQSKVACSDVYDGSLASLNASKRSILRTPKAQANKVWRFRYFRGQQMRNTRFWIHYFQIVQKDASILLLRFLQSLLISLFWDFHSGSFSWREFIIAHCLAYVTIGTFFVKEHSISMGTHATAHVTCVWPVLHVLSCGIWALSLVLGVKTFPLPLLVCVFPHSRRETIKRTCDIIRLQQTVSVIWSMWSTIVVSRYKNWSRPHTKRRQKHFFLVRLPPFVPLLSEVRDSLTFASKRLRVDVNQKKNACHYVT